MALDDFRVWIDVGARDGSEGAIAVELDTRGKLQLSIDPQRIESSGVMGSVGLDYSDAGLLLDALREGMALQLARSGHPSAGAAIAGLRAVRDTPTDG